MNEEKNALTIEEKERINARIYRIEQYEKELCDGVDPKGQPISGLIVVEHREDKYGATKAVYVDEAIENYVAAFGIKRSDTLNNCISLMRRMEKIIDVTTRELSETKELLRDLYDLDFEKPKTAVHAEKISALEEAYAELSERMAGLEMQGKRNAIKTKPDKKIEEPENAEDDVEGFNE